MLRRIGGLLAALLLVVTGTAVTSTVTAAPAHADSCYTWDRTLKEGMSGSDVRQLQIRVSGYPGYRSVLALDGKFGPRTEAAVERFQRAYGLSVDGVAGSQTFNKLYQLQDADCTPANFSYGELNNCNTSWAGGAVSASQARQNALVSMWKLQALRHALGDKPIRVTSGFRSHACNDRVGGISTSRHLYGDGVDLGNLSHSFCTIAKRARYHGFSNILGPGYPGHNDHVHVAVGSTTWSAPSCGI
ncbi:peptidase M15 [Saccharomonospora piscinae]|uniref:Peptidase M15 n=1 Tax=Saccharomonospora piscinae TaxID=687388 RepID=A0A1V9A1S4_SACPI|nr:D-Ala-D-Ala carboxypeptidase family metallohydrolase [Saccharomonospora piscinae]OQO91051.1 peptidase M15 [Saccharomonospora piscinae]TLW93749.1 peptidase M15 [Saccharomonospora piscinae]